jgi:hypothetical protein
VSFPQPNSNEPCIDGLDFFRLITPLESPGDMYESEQGAHAFTIGPDSDVARVAVTYFDENAPGFVQTMEISPERGFQGFVPARNDATYQPSGRAGRILFYPIDLYNPTYTGVGSDLAADEVSAIQPTLDIIEYFSQQPSVIPQRCDKEYVFEAFLKNTADNNTAAIIIPFWGRRFASYQFNNATGHDVSFGVGLVSYSLDKVAPGFMKVQLAPAAVTSGTSVEGVVRAGVDGQYDALYFFFDLSASPTSQTGAQLRLVTSDVAEGSGSNS